MSDTCTTRYGDLVTFGEGDLISRSLRLYGEWAFFETRFLNAILEQVPDACVLDAGAFIGTFTLGILESRPRSVLLVEPNPQARERLQSNVSRVHGTDIFVEDCCLGARAGHVGSGRFRQEGNFGSLSFAYLADGKEGICMDVPVRPLSELREEYGPFDFIKLDVEGSETEVLLSDAAWLRLHHPIVWVECNEVSGAKDIFLALHSMGYKIYYFTYPAFNPKNFRSNTEKIFEGGFEAGLLGVAPSKVIECPADLLEVGAELTELDGLEELRRVMWLTPRWAEEVWSSASRTQLIAYCGRISKKQSFETFFEDLDSQPSSHGVVASPHDNGGNCALYYQLQGQSEFSESQKMELAWEFGRGRSVARFNMEAGSAIQALRFDIADCAGFFEIFEMSIEAADGITLWKWDPTEDLFDGLSNHMKTLYPVDAAPCWIFSVGDDPYARLLLPPAVLAQLGQSAMLVIDFSANLLSTAAATLAEQLSYVTRRKGSDSPGNLSLVKQELVDLVQDVARFLESLDVAFCERQSEVQSRIDENRVLAEKLVTAEAKLEVLRQLLPRGVDA